MTNSTVFHCLLYLAIGISWCNWIISNLKLSFFRIYTFFSFNTNLSFLNTFSSFYFISSTAFTILSFLVFDFLIFNDFFFSFFNQQLFFPHCSNLQLLLQHYLIFIIPLYIFCLIYSSTQTVCSIHTFTSYMLQSIIKSWKKYKVHIVCLWFNF